MAGDDPVALPAVRGPLTAALYALLLGEAEPADDAPSAFSGVSALDDDDLQMALYLCYELHYAGLAGVDERKEWSPAVLMFRAALEREFAAALDQLVGEEAQEREEVGVELQRLV